MINLTEEGIHLNLSKELSAPGTTAATKAEKRSFAPQARQKTKDGKLSTTATQTGTYSIAVFVQIIIDLRIAITTNMQSKFENGSFIF